MNLNRSLRQFHRWLSAAFTAGLIIYVLAMGQGQPALWVGLLALVPLVLLLLTGLYMLIQPYAAKWRGARPANMRG